jgi:hypothetical protein
MSYNTNRVRLFSDASFRGKRKTFSASFVTLLSLCICLIILSGCATFAEKEKAEALDETTTKYGRAIRFGYFELAKIFIRSPENMKKESMGNLTGIKVSSYEVVSKELSTDKLEARHVVEIQYYYTDRLIEKTLHDVQLWKYDVSEEKWYLHSGLPDFR